MAGRTRALYACFHLGNTRGSVCQVSNMVDNASEMHWASAVSERIDTHTAVMEAARALRSERPDPPDLVFVFISPHHAPAYEKLGGWLREEFGNAAIAGCSASGVIGGGCELEGREAVAITAGWLPGARLCVRHLEEGIQPLEEAWVECLDLIPGEPCQFVLFVDPLTCDVDQLLHSLDTAFPSGAKVGGLASASAGDKPSALFAGTEVHHGGALVVSLQGAYELQTVVSQGCRPVGEPFIVTRARGNVIKELNAGKPAEVLRKVYEGMSARDHALFNTSLFLGVGLGENRSRYERGDFVIRNILGIDPESGALATDCRIDNYQVVQFHMRDRETAAQDLTQRLRELMRSDDATRIRGALLFSCLGRGERLFGTANHDSDSFAKRVGPVSLAGFFSNGEIGSVGGKTCLHCYTSVFALFYARP
jgi:small ligand-binding sensory domain FIST